MFQLDSIRELDRDALAHPDASYTWVTDYIVDCHSSRQNPFTIFAGSSEYAFFMPSVKSYTNSDFNARGDVVMISPLSPLASDTVWNIERGFNKGHTEVVRCALWDESVSICDSLRCLVRL